VNNFTSEEQVTILEIARFFLEEADSFDRVSEHLDLNNEEVQGLFNRIADELKDDEPKSEWDKKREAYIKNGFSKCPYCQSDHIEGGGVSVDGDYAWQEVRCVDCNKAWEDIYKLVDVEEKE